MSQRRTYPSDRSLSNSSQVSAHGVAPPKNVLASARVGNGRGQLAKPGTHRILSARVIDRTGFNHNQRANKVWSARRQQESVHTAHRLTDEDDGHKTELLDDADGVADEGVRGVAAQWPLAEAMPPLVEGVDVMDLREPAGGAPPLIAAAREPVQKHCRWTLAAKVHAAEVDTGYLQETSLDIHLMFKG
jgi:hypothetical protein